jgi:hypothetical protein
MSSRDEIRAADADRERAAARLNEALDEGRLSLHELDERLRQVYEARTFGELDRVLADLPSPAPPSASQVVPTVPTASVNVPPSRHQENPRLPTWLSVSWRLWLVAVAVNLVVWFLVSLTSGSVVYFWPMWVAGPWAAANLGLMILFPPRHRPG